MSEMEVMDFDVDEELAKMEAMEMESKTQTVIVGNTAPTTDWDHHAKSNTATPTLPYIPTASAITTPTDSKPTSSFDRHDSIQRVTSQSGRDTTAAAAATLLSSSSHSPSPILSTSPKTELTKETPTNMGRQWEEKEKEKETEKEKDEVQELEDELFIDTGDAVDPADSELTVDAAATRIQAIQRGRQTRKSLKEQRESAMNDDQPTPVATHVTDAPIATAPVPTSPSHVSVESFSVGEDEWTTNEQKTNTDPTVAVASGNNDEYGPGADVAATRIQSVHRGRMARQQLKEERQQRRDSRSGSPIPTESTVAAASIAANSIDATAAPSPSPSSSNFHLPPVSDHHSSPSSSPLDADTAATRIQSLHRGRMTRKQLQVQQQSMPHPATDSPSSSPSAANSLDADSAATRIQSLHRGRMTRKRLMSQQSSSIMSGYDEPMRIGEINVDGGQDGAIDDDLDSTPTDADAASNTAMSPDAAAIRIQSVHRGRMIRKQLKHQQPSIKDDEDPLQVDDVVEDDYGDDDFGSSSVPDAPSSLPADQSSITTSPVASSSSISTSVMSRDAAATRIQSLHRSRAVRKQMKERKEQMQKESTAQPGEGPNEQQPFNQQPNDELGAEVEIEDIEEDEYADEDFVSSPPRTAATSSSPQEQPVPDPLSNVSMSPDAAATRIQDVQRGRHVRKQLQEERTKLEQKQAQGQEHAQSQASGDDHATNEHITPNDAPSTVDDATSSIQDTDTTQQQDQQQQLQLQPDHQQQYGDGASAEGYDSTAAGYGRDGCSYDQQQQYQQQSYDDGAYSVAAQHQPTDSYQQDGNTTADMNNAPADTTGAATYDYNQQPQAGYDQYAAYQTTNDNQAYDAYAYGQVDGGTIDNAAAAANAYTQPADSGSHQAYDQAAAASAYPTATDSVVDTATAPSPDAVPTAFTASAASNADNVEERYDDEFTPTAAPSTTDMQSQQYGADATNSTAADTAVESNTSTVAVSASPDAGGDEYASDFEESVVADDIASSPTPDSNTDASQQSHSLAPPTNVSTPIHSVSEYFAKRASRMHNSSSPFKQDQPLTYAPAAAIPVSRPFGVNSSYSNPSSGHATEGKRLSSSSSRINEDGLPEYLRLCPFCQCATIVSGCVECRDIVARFCKECYEEQHLPKWKRGHTRIQIQPPSQQLQQSNQTEEVQETIPEEEQPTDQPTMIPAAVEDATPSTTQPPSSQPTPSESRVHFSMRSPSLSKNSESGMGIDERRPRLSINTKTSPSQKLLTITSTKFANAIAAADANDGDDGDGGDDDYNYDEDFDNDNNPLSPSQGAQNEANDNDLLSPGLSVPAALASALEQEMRQKDAMDGDNAALKHKEHVNVPAPQEKPQPLPPVEHKETDAKTQDRDNSSSGQAVESQRASQRPSQRQKQPKQQLQAGQATQLPSRLKQPRAIAATSKSPSRILAPSRIPAAAAPRKAGSKATNGMSAAERKKKAEEQAALLAAWDQSQAERAKAAVQAAAEERKKRQAQKKQEQAARKAAASSASGQGEAQQQPLQSVQTQLQQQQPRSAPTPFPDTHSLPVLERVFPVLLQENAEPSAPTPAARPLVGFSFPYSLLFHTISNPVRLIWSDDKGMLCSAAWGEHMKQDVINWFAQSQQQQDPSVQNQPDPDSVVVALCYSLNHSADSVALTLGQLKALFGVATATGQHGLEGVAQLGPFLLQQFIPPPGSRMVAYRLQADWSMASSIDSGAEPKLDIIECVNPSSFDITTGAPISPMQAVAAKHSLIRERVLRTDTLSEVGPLCGEPLQALRLRFLHFLTCLRHFVQTVRGEVVIKCSIYVAPTMDGAWNFLFSDLMDLHSKDEAAAMAQRQAQQQQLQTNAPLKAPAVLGPLIGSPAAKKGRHSTPSHRSALSPPHHPSIPPSSASSSTSPSTRPFKASDVAMAAPRKVIDRTRCVKCGQLDNDTGRRSSEGDKLQLIMLRQVLLKWVRNEQFEYPEDLFAHILGADTNPNSPDWYRCVVAICKPCKEEIAKLKTIPARTQLAPWLAKAAAAGDVDGKRGGSRRETGMNAGGMNRAATEPPTGGSVLPYLAKAPVLHPTGSGFSSLLRPPTAKHPNRKNRLPLAEAFESGDGSSSMNMGGAVGGGGGGHHSLMPSQSMPQLRHAIAGGAGTAPCQPHQPQRKARAGHMEQRVKARRNAWKDPHAADGSSQQAMLPKLGGAAGGTPSLPVLTSPYSSGQGLVQRALAELEAQRETQLRMAMGSMQVQMQQQMQQQLQQQLLQLQLMQLQQQQQQGATAAAAGGAGLFSPPPHKSMRNSRSGPMLQPLQPTMTPPQPGYVYAHAEQAPSASTAATYASQPSSSPSSASASSQRTPGAPVTLPSLSPPAPSSFQSPDHHSSTISPGMLPPSPVPGSSSQLMPLPNVAPSLTAQQQYHNSIGSVPTPSPVPAPTPGPASEPAPAAISVPAPVSAAASAPAQQPAPLDNHPINDLTVADDEDELEEEIPEASGYYSDDFS